ncbi:MAG: hypothetical protein JRE57_18810 [Deltaproteobacteria bacterium]|nr:hypothetical protein [Deltaproteobacteria bacterium]
MKLANVTPWLILLCWLAFRMLSEETIALLAVEDGLIENLGAAGFFAAAVLFYTAFRSSLSAGNDFGLLRTNRNFFFLLLAIAFAFAGAEEISWGQRIFGWETPDSLARINSQDETTIHNLEFFQHGKSFSFVFNVFWLGFCVCVPVLDRWRPARAFFRRIGLPVVPIWTGALLLTNYAVFKLVGSDYQPGSELRHAANELKESTIAVIFGWIAWVAFQQERGTDLDSDSDSGA